MQRRLASLLAVLVLGCTGEPGAAEQKSGQALPSCDWCGATEASPGLTSEAQIAGPDEPGERLVITGTVYEPDGRTPALGVVISESRGAGRCPSRRLSSGRCRRHSRAWVKSDDRGRYRFTTIRPGRYPEGTEAAHVHLTVLEPGGEEYWIDPIMFEGDPLLTPERRRHLKGRGGSGVIKLVRGKDGAWAGVRDIVLNHRLATVAPGSIRTLLPA